MNQSTYELSNCGASQCALILQRLRETPAQWVPMPDLASVSGSYVVHSRVADLRKRGHTIEHRNERHGSKVHSFYMLQP